MASVYLFAEDCWGKLNSYLVRWERVPLRFIGIAKPVRYELQPRSEPYRVPLFDEYLSTMPTSSRNHTEAC